MKIRTDFVTNSSSSSFILAQDGKLNDRQKEELLKYIEDCMLGSEVLKPNASEEDIKQAIEDEYAIEHNEEKVRQALNNGKSIRVGWVVFEDSDYQLSRIYEDIWSILEENSDGNFEAIDTDLSY